MIRILDIVHDTMVDGPGFRTAIYCAGCPNACPGCHNPQSWDPNGGHAMSTESILSEIVTDPFANVTFTGGDPMFQPEGFLELSQAIHRETRKTIWCYTGLTFETLLNHPTRLALLHHIEVLVDGPFIQARRDADLPFRGSGNQRLIDVRQSLATHSTVVFNYNTQL